jgi:DNA-binding Lrp family transcriptional regulator
LTNIRLDDLDLRLIHALQIEPRASWNALAPILDSSAVTLARRWEALTASGLAWVTGAPTAVAHAVIEIACVPSRIEETIGALLADGTVQMLDLTTGERDLIASVSAPSLGALSDYLVHRLSSTPGISSTNAHVLNESFTDGSRWRMDALRPQEQAAIPAARGQRPRAARDVPDDLRQAIEHEVWRDGRVPISEIADKHGFAVQRVSDALATLRAQSKLLFRTDLATVASGWPVYTWYFLEASAREVQGARAALSRVREARFAFASAGRYNLILSVTLRSVADINRFELALGAAFADSRIADRAMVMRGLKHLGRPVNADGTIVKECNSRP